MTETNTSSGMEFAFAVGDDDGKRIIVRIDCLDNGYLRIKTLDAHDNEKTFLVQWINGKWHRHKLSKDDGVEDTCPVHSDGRHRHDTDAMTPQERWESTDLRVVGNVLPPQKCACGQIKYLGVDF